MNGTQGPSAALVVLLPAAMAAAAGSEILRQAWEKLDSWSGRIFVIEEQAPTPARGAAANTFLEIIDVIVDEGESVGRKTRIEAGTGDVKRIADGLRRLAPSVDRFVLMGRDRTDLIQTLTAELRKDDITVQTLAELVIGSGAGDRSPEVGDDPPLDTSGAPLVPP